MKLRPIPFALLLALAVLLVGAVAVLAQAPQPTAVPTGAAAQASQVSDDQVNAVARELYCPVCENIPLDVCPTQACAQWRELIRQKLADGWSKDQIKQYFAAQYGDRVLAEPPAQGLNWIVYILPPVAFLVGVFLVYRVLSSRKPAAKPGAAPVETPPANDPYLRRLEEELKKRN